MRLRHDFRHFLALCGTIALSACSGNAPEGNAVADRAEQASPAGNAATPRNAALANAAAPAAGPQTLSAKTDALTFTYKWPAEAATIPELSDWLRGNGDKIRVTSEKSARADQASAKQDGYPFHGHSYEESYAVVGDTPRMLVLLSEGYVYTGGAHGMPIATAILWDKAAKKRLATTALIDLPRLATLARKRFCAALDAQRAEKRGEPVKHDPAGDPYGFNDCVDMTKQLVLPISKDGKALDTVRTVIGPYEAGPYAEGSYVIDLPLDATLRAAVKEGYRDAFAAG